MGYVCRVTAGIRHCFRCGPEVPRADSIVVTGRGRTAFPSYSVRIFCYILQRCSCAYVTFLTVRLARSIQDNTIGLVVYSIPMVAGALSRADPGHVLYNGIGIFLASMFYVSNYATVWNRYKAAFVVVMTVLQLSPLSLLVYLPAFARIWTHPQNETINLSSLYPSWHGEFFAPAGYKPNGIGTYLSPQVEYGHYEGFENANAVEAIQEKLAEIRGHPEKALLLPVYFNAYCNVNVPADRFVMSLLFAFPYYGKAVHLEAPRQPICDYVHANYDMERAPTPQDFEYGLWVPNGEGDAAP